MIQLGFDIGSRAVKLVSNEDGKLSDFLMFDTIKFYREYGARGSDGFRVDIARLGIDRFDRIVSTGYGRENVKLAGTVVIPETEAHTIGAAYPSALSDFVLLDLGGQDSKVVLVKGGNVMDFYMNDRCAASTGRFLENSAKVLGLSLDELSGFWEEPEKLASTCAIFAESELIGKIASGVAVERLAAGVNHSVIARFLPFLKRFDEKKLVVVGGVAKNHAVVHILKDMGYDVVIPRYPQFNGAIGCAIWGIC